jgi:uridine kinase
MISTINSEAPFVLGIAGGTGSGKSSLAFGLQDKFPGNVALLQLDDYFIPEGEMSRMAGFSNWDDPDSLNHEKFAADLASLIGGKAISVATKNSRLNPDYYTTYRYKTVEIEPKPLIVVEGFMLLHYPAIRQLLSKSVYLDAPFDVISSRRIHPADNAYKQGVIAPMLENYVRPSAEHADLVIDVAQNSQDQVLEATLKLLPVNQFDN